MFRPQESAALLAQPGVLAEVAPAGRYLTLKLAPDASPHGLFERLGEVAVDEGLVVGLGAPLAKTLGVELTGLHAFPALEVTSPPIAIPSTQGALFLHARGDDSGQLLHRLRQVLAQLGEGLLVHEEVVAFRHKQGSDLSGFEDGTENPKGEAAEDAAIVQGQGPGLDGGSFVAVQRWVHQLHPVERLPKAERDALIGRDRETNEELADAPPSAHVKRSAQEDFEPAAFMVRRSMPYGTVAEHGLYFVAYGATLSAFERVLQRMAGHDDGVVDGLFQFSRPVSGGYYWCPPLHQGRLDLRAITR
jgi:putative iron-dependent peroxidase